MANASTWCAATVTNVVAETPTVKTFTFELPHTVEHMPGQHYEIRLTAPNGYQAARLYSAASVATGSTKLQLTIALLQGGEVSPYMHEHVQPGSQVELRGPLGRFFIWDGTMSDPVLLIAGGSGVVPMRCILQAHASLNSTAPMTLLYSARDYDEIIYKPELLAPGALHTNTTITLSDGHPAGWPGRIGRIDADLLQTTLNQFATLPACYICGTNQFVEAMANNLIALHMPAERIKTERFGG